MQPHTSAGRIPTDKGYRLFVDRLAGLKPLSAAERKAIATFMTGAVDMDDIVDRTVRLLAQLTHQVAIVQYPVVSTATIRHVELVGLTPDRVMIVLVNSSGRIAQRTLDLPEHSDDDLATLRDRLVPRLLGGTSTQAVSQLAGALDEMAPAQRPLGAPLVASLLEILAADQATRVVVGGVPNLTRFGDQFAATVKPVLEALEEQMVLLRLLGEASSVGDVTVRIGQENTYAKLQQTSVVASTYGTIDDVWANLGVVGPTRMDYPTTIASVRAVARYVGRFLAEG